MSKKWSSTAPIMAHQITHNDVEFIVKKIALIGVLASSFAISVAAQTSVSVSPLSELATYPGRFAPATVVSLNEPEISAQITAQIISVPVRVGDVVSAGETLVQLDCTEYELRQQSAEASLESIQARYRLTELNLERELSLSSNNLISIGSIDSRRTELEALSAELKAAQANLNINQLNVSRCEVKAPFDALVLERMASVGQLATAGFVGTALARILDLNSLEISAQIFSSDAAQLSRDLKLNFESNGNSYPVQLNNLVGALNSSTRNREARLQFLGESALPGSSGKIVWRDPRPHLPPDYAVERGGNLGFFISNGQRAEFQILEGAQQGRSNPVNLPLNTLVIVEGYAGLRDGQTISISN